MALLTAALMTLPMVAARAADPITEEEAHAIGVDAYIYFYPLLSMDITRQQLTNIEAAKGAIGGPPNLFNNIAEFPTADMRVVVRPNFDTLYSSAWLDLTKEPVVVSAPDTQGRYYLLPMLDMWTDVFASPGWRTTGTGAGNFLIAPPGWRPDFATGSMSSSCRPEPRGSMRRRPMSGSSGGPRRTARPTMTPSTRSRRVTRSPCSRSGARSQSRSTSKIDPSVDMKTPPKVQVDTCRPRLFRLCGRVMKLNPPHITDQPILARMKRIGIEPGKSFDLSKADPAVQKALATVPQDAQALMAWKLPTIARVDNGWSMNTDTMGVYGNYYLKRAIVAQQGLGANLPEDAIYPFNLADEDGQAARWQERLHPSFREERDSTRPGLLVGDAYDDQGFQVANSINRFAVSSWMPFQYNADGSLDLYFQSKSPGKDKEWNWLPSPAGPYNLTMRLYAPQQNALTGKWTSAPVVKSGAVPALAVQ